MDVLFIFIGLIGVILYLLLRKKVAFNDLAVEVEPIIIQQQLQQHHGQNGHSMVQLQTVVIIYLDKFLQVITSHIHQEQNLGVMDKVLVTEDLYLYQLINQQFILS